MNSKMYMFESDGGGFNTKTYFYDTGTEVVAFDAQFTPALAQQALDYLKTQTPNPVTYLVITHPSPDKFNGAKVFKEAGAKIVASEATKAALDGVHAYKKYYFVNIAKMFTDDSYPSMAEVDQTFSDKHTLQVGDKTVELTELHMGAVASNHTVAFIPDMKALVVGDVIHHKAHAWMEGPIVGGKTAYSTQAWINLLNKLMEIFPADATVYAGRGETAPLETAVKDQIAYLEKAESITKEFITSIPEGDKSKADYAQLTAKFKEAFPDYGLDYMVTYGGYGIVASL